MKALLALVLTLFPFLHLFAQDGSNIAYIPEAKIDTSLIGKTVHFDFFRNSFAGFEIDTVNLSINGTEFSFIEVRNDNSFNNWFGKQYLLSVDTFDSKTKLTVDKAQILKITTTEIEARIYISYQTDEDLPKRPLSTTKVTIQRADVHTVLVAIQPAIRKGISIYGVYQTPPDFTQEVNTECLYCFTPTADQLTIHPIIQDWDIKSFDYENQTIELTENGKRAIEQLEIPLAGLPVVLTLNGEILYELWFWNLFSSFGYDRVFAYPKLDFSLDFGLPKNHAFGEDPRFHPKLRKYLKTK